MGCFGVLFTCGSSRRDSRPSWDASFPISFAKSFETWTKHVPQERVLLLKSNIAKDMRAQAATRHTPQNPITSNPSSRFGGAVAGRFFFESSSRRRSLSSSCVCEVLCVSLKCEVRHDVASLWRSGAKVFSGVRLELSSETEHTWFPTRFAAVRDSFLARFWVLVQVSVGAEMERSPKSKLQVVPPVSGNPANTSDQRSKNTVRGVSSSKCVPGTTGSAL